MRESASRGGRARKRKLDMKKSGALLSLSDKSAVDVVGDLDVVDCATGSFCSSCAIPPRVAGGLWSDGVGCDACSFPFGLWGAVSWVWLRVES